MYKIDRYIIFIFSLGPSKTAANSKNVRQNMVNSARFTEIVTRGQGNKKIVWFYAKNINKITDYQPYLDSIKSDLIEKLSEYTRHRPIKFHLKLESTYIRVQVENSTDNRSFQTTSNEIFAATNIGTLVSENFSKLLADTEQYTGQGSAFHLEKID